MTENSINGGEIVYLYDFFLNRLTILTILLSNL